MRNYFVLLGIISFVTCNAANVCMGLLLGGGGDRAAYQAGVIKALVEYEAPGRHAYNNVIGISGGAINAAMFAKYGMGNEDQVSWDMLEMWRNIKHTDMYKFWPSKWIVDVWKHPSLLDTSIQHDFVKRLFNPERLAKCDRNVYVSATEFDGWRTNLISTRNSSFLDAVVASSAFPAIYPPVLINGTMFIDGAFAFTAPIKALVDMCPLGSSVFVDIILPNGDLEFDPVFDKLERDLRSMPNLIQVIDTVAQNMASSLLLNDYRKPWPGVEIRLFQPSEPLGGMYLSFTETKRYIELGYNDTVTKLKQ